MDGLKPQSFRLIIRWMVSTLVLGLFFGADVLGSRSVLAQSMSARVESASQKDTNIYIRVSIPRGQVTESAELVLGETGEILVPSPVALPTVLWLVVDRSESVINTASNIHAAIRTLVQGQPVDTRVGLILYDSTLTIYQPTTNMSDLETWLSGYSGRANTPGCLGDALTALSEQELPDGYAQRVLVIAGALSRQGKCSSQGYVEVGSPIEVIVVANETDDLFQDVVDQSNGRLYRANISTIANRIDEVRALWSSPIYELTGSAEINNNRGRLTLNLSDGSSIGLQVSLQQEADKPAPTAQVTGGLQIMGGNPTATETRPLETASVSTAVFLGASTEVIAPDVQGVNVSQVPATFTSMVALSPTVPKTTATQATSQAAVPITTSLSPTSVSAPSTAVPSTESKGTSPIPLESPSSDSGKISAIDLLNDSTLRVPVLMAGVLIVLLVLVTLRFILGQRSAKASHAKTGTVALFENTMIVDPTQMDLQVSSTLPDRFDNTEIVTPEDLGVSIFETTEMVTVDELLANFPVFGLQDSHTNQVYYVRRPHTSLGRDKICNIVIDYDNSLSREHVIFRVQEQNGENDVAVVLEIRTRNPILLNGKAVAATTQPLIKVGDELTLSRLCKLLVIPAKETLG